MISSRLVLPSPPCFGELFGAHSSEHVVHGAPRLGRDEHVRRQQILVHPTIAALPCVEPVLHPRHAPNAYKLGQKAVDLVHQRLAVFETVGLEDELEAQQVARSMDAAIGASGALETDLVRVDRVVRRDGTGGAEGVKDVTFDGFHARVDLESRVADTAVAELDGDFAFG